MYCYHKCSVAVLRGAVGWSAVCNLCFPDHTHLLFYNAIRQMLMKLTKSCLMAIRVLHCIMHAQIKH